jgi:ribosomal protein S18 acetylase RimI-like enzyme
LAPVWAPVAGIDLANGSHEQVARATVQVRAARKADLPAMLELEQSCFDTYSLGKRQLQYLHRSPSAVARVAERDGRVVGQSIALVRHHRNGATGRLYSLAVRGDCRGQGIGRDLLADAIAALVARGVKRIYLEVERSNAGAIALYERVGFRPIGTLADYYGPGRDGVHMMTEIATPAPADAPTLAPVRAA